MFLGFISCENDLEKISKLTSKDISADELSDSLTVVYTDSSKVKFIIFGQKVEKYNEPKTKTIINDGLKVRFFNSKEENTAVLTSRYGEIKEREGKITCKYNVVFNNIEKDQTLFTEELLWNQKTKKIFTPGNVTIKDGDKYLYGTGMEAEEDFSSYEIIEPTAKVPMKSDKDSIKNEKLQ